MTDDRRQASDTLAVAAAGDTVPVAPPAAESNVAPVNLFGLDRQQLRAEFERMGESAYRADQVMQWIYRRGVDDFELMTNLSKKLRLRLAECFVIHTPELITEQVSVDGTRKWLLRVGPAKNGGDAAIETVFIPAAGRGTLCISSQVGCAMDCSFCSTAQQGFSRNLSSAEIVAQVWFAARTLGADFQHDCSEETRKRLIGEGAIDDSDEDDELDPDERKAGRIISNVVFMGMGEPLANYANMLTAVRILLDDFGFGLSKRRVTISTSGLVPFMDRLHADIDTALAVSLHAPNDALRDQLVPINKKYPIAQLMDACRRYVAGRDRKTHIVFEYVMLDGINDKPEHARELAKIIAGLPAKVNLIPFNPFPETRYKRSSATAIAAFAEQLRSRRVMTTVRRTRGDDIDAACGQLVGRVKSRQKQRLGDIPVVASR